MKAINVYVVFQADGIDHEIADLQIMDDPGALGRFSQSLEAGGLIFKLWAEGHGGRVVALIQGGGILEVSVDSIADLPELQAQYEGRVDCSLSIGVGLKLSEAQRALKAAQQQGRGKLKLYDTEVETQLAEELSKADSIVHNNKTTLNSTDGGGGMKGATEPSRAAPIPPATEASEHSENEALQNRLAETPDPLSQFSSLAEQSEGQEQEKQASEEEQQQGDDVKSQLVEILQSFREQAPLFEQLKQSSPELYKTLVGMVQAMVKMGQQLYSQPEADAQGGQVEQVAKSDDLQKDLMPGGKGDNKPDTEFDDEQLRTGIRREMAEHGLDAARAKEIAKDHLTENPDYYKLDKASLEAGKTGRHQVVLPVGSQKDSGANGTREVGKIKVQTPEGPTKWRSVRAGLVMATDGTPTSSRNNPQKKPGQA